MTQETNRLKHGKNDLTATVFTNEGALPHYKNALTLKHRIQRPQVVTGLMSALDFGLRHWPGLFVWTVFGAGLYLLFTA